MTFVVSGEKLTTVQQSGQNHHINSSANSRKTTSNDMSTMVPSNCGQEQHYWTGIRGLNVSKKISKGEIKKKWKYSQPPLMTETTEETSERKDREED